MAPRVVRPIKPPPPVEFRDAIAINGDNQGEYVLQGSCQKEGDEITYLLQELESEGEQQQQQEEDQQWQRQGTTTCLDGEWQTPPIDTTELEHGAMVEISISVGSFKITQTVTKDIEIPSIALDELVEFATFDNHQSFPIGGSCSEAGTVFFSLGGVSGKTPCRNKEWSALVDLSIEGDGEVSVGIVLQDLAGNRSPEVQGDFFKDATPPHLSIRAESFYINIANKGSFALSGECDEVSRSVDIVVSDLLGGSLAASATCGSDHNWAVTLDTEDLQDGPVTAVADHGDLAGNTSRATLGNLMRDTVAAGFARGSAKGPVGVPEDGNYDDANLLFTIRYNELVRVSGTPRLRLGGLSDGHHRYAIFTEVVDGTELRFVYGVSGGDATANGLTLDAAIDLDSGSASITDLAGNPAPTASVPWPGSGHLSGVNVNGPGLAPSGGHGGQC